jgi:putative tRNA adenosine deaminase-associated protein
MAWESEEGTVGDALEELDAPPQTGLDELDDDDVDELIDDDVDDLGDDDLDAEDDLEDAEEEEIDFCVGLYREDGEPTGVALDPELANDFEELIAQLQRVPGDAGAIGLVSLDSEVLVAARVRGPRHVQVFVSDAYHYDTWPLVRDAIDFLGLEPGVDDAPEDGAIGDLNIFADQGLSEMALEAMCMDEEEVTSEELATRIAKAIRFETPFRKAVEDYWDVEDVD